MKISAVYKIVNTVTKDFYIGSSKNVKHRWVDHKCPSTWKNYPNSKLYKDMQKYGVDKFDFQILVTTEPERLKEIEQEFIETLKPTYNDKRANGFDVERHKEYLKKEYQKKKEYFKKEYQQKSEKYKKRQNKYNNQLCFYNEETLTLNALTKRFRRIGIDHPAKEAKKYLLKNVI